MKKNSVKGFTLIELLAVIIIMGVLMMTAIPAVTRYIENSRKDTFWQTAKSYIDAARTSLLAGEYGVSVLYTTDTTVTTVSGLECEVPPAKNVTIIPLSIIELEKGGTQSSFNRSIAQVSSATANVGKATNERGYVLAVNTGTNDKIVYYVAMVDAGKNGIDKFTSESQLARSVVKKGTANANSSTTAEMLGQVKNKVASSINTVGRTVPTMTIGGTSYSIYEYCN